MKSKLMKSPMARALLARLLCLSHIVLSIFVLHANISKDMVYLFPTIGAVLLIIETAVVLVLLKGKTTPKLISPLLVIYVPTIVACYLFLELENINKLLKGQTPRNYQQTISDGDYSIISVGGRSIWSKIELQTFFALVILVNWIDNDSRLLKIFAISCDMLDFLTITQDQNLIRNSQLVYWSLSVWTWSTIQLFLFVPKSNDAVEKGKFQAYFTNSLLNVLFLDLPYFGIRIASILAFGTHSYNSYFFAAKNFVLIVFQFYRIKETFLERDVRETKEVQQLKDRLGFDKEPSKIFDQGELARRNFFTQRFKIQGENDQDFSIQNSLEGLHSDTPEEINVNIERIGVILSSHRIPRTIESVKNANKYVGRVIERDQISPDSIDDCLSDFHEPKLISNLVTNLEESKRIKELDLNESSQLYSTNNKKFTEV